MADLIVSISNTAKAAPDMEYRAVSKAGSFTAKMIRAEIKRATNQGQRLTNLRNQKINIGYDPPTRANPKVEIYGRGPWRVVEYGTKAHVIPRQRKRGRRRYAAFGGHVYSRVNHPGTRGKHPIHKGYLRAEPDIPRVMQEVVRGMVVKAWGI